MEATIEGPNEYPVEQVDEVIIDKSYAVEIIDIQLFDFMYVMVEYLEEGEDGELSNCQKFYRLGKTRIIFDNPNTTCPF